LLIARKTPRQGHASIGLFSSDGDHGKSHSLRATIALRARSAIDEQHSRFGAFLYRVTDMNTQESEIRLLTGQELGGIAGAMGVDVPVQILGRTLHISASTDFGISGAY
jgi:hypothetical protein